jgi:hypothetical protein
MILQENHGLQSVFFLSSFRLYARQTCRALTIGPESTRATDCTDPARATIFPRAIALAGGFSRRGSIQGDQGFFAEKSSPKPANLLAGTRPRA